MSSTDRVNLPRLGQEIRKFRDVKGLSQLDFALACGKQPNAISKIEGGKRRPTTRTIDQICETLDLLPSDCSLLYGLAGYLPETKEPPLYQVERLMKAMEIRIANYEYPAYVIDHKFWFRSMNSATVALIGGMKQALTVIQQGFHAFDAIFSTSFPLHSGFKHLKTLQEDQVFRFKGVNVHRRHEQFYDNYPVCMKQRLLAKDYGHFEAVWNRVVLSEDSHIAIYPAISLSFGGNVGDVDFDIHPVDWFQMPGLFFSVYYQPVRDSDRMAWERYMSKFALPNQAFRV